MLTTASIYFLSVSVALAVRKEIQPHEAVLLLFSDCIHYRTNILSCPYQSRIGKFTRVSVTSYTMPSDNGTLRIHDGGRGQGRGKEGKGGGARGAGGGVPKFFKINLKLAVGKQITSSS